jgi:hypothetical protein
MYIFSYPDVSSSIATMKVLVPLNLKVREVIFFPGYAQDILRVKKVSGPWTNPLK